MSANKNDNGIMIEKRKGCTLRSCSGNWEDQILELIESKYLRNSVIYLSLIKRVEDISIDYDIHSYSAVTGILE